MNNQALFGTNRGAARALLNAGANVNARRVGLTPLMYAARQGHRDMTDLLIQYGANRNAVDRLGCTPLIYAVIGGHAIIGRTLILAGARVNHQDNNGSTALMLASERGELMMVEDLVMAGANVNLRDNAGRTALDYALIVGHTRCANYLRARGAGLGNFNWNSRGNLIPMPNKLRNNKNAFTANRFKFGVPYVQVKTPTGKFYYSKAGFKKWYESKKTDPLTKAKLNNKNLKIVRFEVPKNIQNKAQTMRRQRAARTIARTLRRR